MITGQRGDIKLIGLIGAESTGKSTLAHMLVGRLRTHGLKVELSAEPGARRPFPPALLDTLPVAQVFTVINKLHSEAQTALMANVEYIVSDRTPLDLYAYYHTRYPTGSFMMDSLGRLCNDWMAHYDALYYLPTEDTTYVEDGHRAPKEINDFREKVDEYCGHAIDRFRSSLTSVQTVRGNYRGRAEWVYHHVLATFLGQTRPLRAYDQVRGWLSSRGHRVVEVRPQGSNSITRFHPASDTDDIDAIVVVDGDADYAIKVREDFMAHKDQLENIVQADLDLLITPKGLEAYEV